MPDITKKNVLFKYIDKYYAYKNKHKGLPGRTIS